MHMPVELSEAYLVVLRCAFFPYSLLALEFLCPFSRVCDSVYSYLSQSQENIWVLMRL